MSRPVVWVAVALWVGGCPGDRDDGAGDLSRVAEQVQPRGETSAAGVPERELELLTDSSLQLGFGEQARLEVRLTDDEGAPLEGASVSFALMGRAEDISLESLDAETDADGQVSNVLIAGNTTAAFRVRVSAPGADELSIEVAVSDAGFGELLVDVPYEGARLVSKRVVTVLANMACDDAMRTAGDPMATLDEGMRDPARFGSLPAGTTYAVVAAAEGQEETVVAEGCSDGVVVEPGEPREITVAFVDRPLLPVGRFAMTAEFEASQPAQALSGVLLGAARTLIEGDGSAATLSDAEAVFMLDSLLATLRSEEFAASPLAALVEAIPLARQDPLREPSLESTLASTLQAAEAGPMLTAQRMAELSEQALSRMRVSAELAVLDEPSDGSWAIEWQAQRMEALSQLDGVAPRAIDLRKLASNDGLVDGMSLARFEASRDVLVLEAVPSQGAFGALAIDVLNTLVATGAAGAGDELRARLGCAELPAWLAAQALGTGTCDEACVAALCDRALARIVGAVEGALRPLDQSRPVLSLSGELHLIDDDGDLVIEEISAEVVQGEWPAAEIGEAADELSGEANGQAIVE